MKWIHMLSNWYAYKGKIIFAKIAYVFAWINAVLTMIETIAVPIIFTATGDFDAWVIVLSVLVGLPFMFFVNLLIVSFTKGEVVWLENIRLNEQTKQKNQLRSLESLNSQTSPFFTSEKVVFDEKNTKTEEHNGTTEETTNNADLIKKGLNTYSENPRTDSPDIIAIDGDVVFIKDYTGLDSNDQLIEIPMQSIGKIIKKDAASSDIEWIDKNGKKRIVLYVPNKYCVFKK